VALTDQLSGRESFTQAGRHGNRSLSAIRYANRQRAEGANGNERTVGAANSEKEPPTHTIYN
jgi:hypothetical protein